MRDVKTIREAFAEELGDALADTLKAVHPWRPRQVGSPPVAVLNSLPSPITMRPGSLQVVHRFELEVILAVRANIEAALTEFTGMAETILNALHRSVRAKMATEHGVHLFTIDYRQDEARYGSQDYVTLVIGLQMKDVEGETFV